MGSGGRWAGSVQVPVPAILLSFTALGFFGLVNVHRFTEPNPAPVGTLDTGTKRRRQVLLVTYGRSGSSFTSALIQADRTVFYFFEPLYSLGLLYISKRKESLETQRTPWGNDKLNDSLTLMQSYLFDCQNNNATTLKNRQHLLSNDTAGAYKCLSARTDGWKHLACYNDMVKRCRARDVTLVKSIRFRVKWTKTLMEDHPDMKLLYLIRDPRAVLRSQAKVFRKFSWDSAYDIQTVARKHCNALGEDVKHLRELKTKWPHRVKVIRYEDGALDPHNYARSIYRFLELNYTADVQKQVEKITSSPSSPQHNKSRTQVQAYTVFRKDPSMTMQRWRYDAGYRTVAVIERQCSRLYPVFGYLPVTSQRELEGNMNLVVDPDKRSSLF